MFSTEFAILVTITTERDASRNKQLITELKPRASKGYPKLKSNTDFVCLFLINIYPEASNLAEPQPSWWRYSSSLTAHRR